jgi:hypothetical protein
MFLNYAASKKKPKGDLSSLVRPADLEGAIKDLEDGEALGKRGRSSSYWPKIREVLLDKSSSSDIDEAIKEWESDGLPYIAEGTCELCGKTPIKYRFPIRNRTKGSKLVVGCECIYHYLEIGGYEAPEAVLRKLNAQKAILKKIDKGLVSEDELAKLSKVEALEGQIRRLISAIAGGAKDLDIFEYEQALSEVVGICNALGIKNESSKRGDSAHIVSYQITRSVKSTQALQKGVGNGLGSYTSALMAKRKLDEKLVLLETYFDQLADLANFGPASQVVALTWGAVAERKDSLLASVQKKCDKGKSQLTEDYRFECDLVRQYRNLSAILEAGLKAQRDLFESQLEVVRKSLTADDFIDQLRKESSIVSKALRINFYPDLSNSDEAAQRAAYNVGVFAEFVGQKGYLKVQDSIEDTYKLEKGSIRDGAGIQISLFRAADESLIDADVMGARAIDVFEDLVRSKNPRVLEIVEQEVNEVADLIKESRGLSVVQKMTQDLGFNVEKVFQLFSSKNPEDMAFCMDIVQRWSSGELYDLTPAQMKKVQKQLTTKGSSEDVRDSVWDKLRAKLATKFDLFK